MKKTPDEILSDAKNYLVYQLQRKLRGDESVEEQPTHSLKDLKDAIAILNRCKYLLKHKHPQLTVPEINTEFLNLRRIRVSQFGKNK